MLSEKIRSIRKQKGIKQSEIATALGVETNNYPRIERRGDKMTVEMLYRIAKALDTSVSELLETDQGQDAVIKDLSAKLERLRISNKLLRRKQDVMATIIGMYRSQLNEYIDKVNSEQESDHDSELDGLTYEELMALKDELEISLQGKQDDEI